jgi:UDP-N-acetylglucosamine--N-acetylmuramyl-(pentapeptide) pyrophosphoryl-undecaprenol N-acetylglucosamine transferase
VAVAESLRETDPKAAVIYVGRAGGPESELVPAAGLEFVGMTLGRMGSSQVTATPRLLTRLPLAYQQARRAFSRFAPDVVLATGGYVSLPVALVAGRRRVPVLLMEQNALPGRAVRWLAPRAAVVATSFAGTAALLPEAKVTCTGNPVRSSFAQLVAPKVPTEAPFSLLVMGGSQGARNLNEVLLEALPELWSALPGLGVCHLTGSSDHARVLRAVESLQLPAGSSYQALPFVDDIATRVAGAGLVLMRAGGSSLAEVACLGKPMVLVPYPHAGNHQVANARPFVEAGAATMIEDEELTAAGLVRQVKAILGSPERWAQMAEASAAMGRPRAAHEVAELLGGLALSRS